MNCWNCGSEDVQQEPWEVEGHVVQMMTCQHCGEPMTYNGEEPDEYDTLKFIGIRRYDD